ncbi:TrkH family potassium uptake protein [Litchfieldia alkalitelluris]|uniref:TrkH family potassium uptake protein n=1 Tax=Litchfieldia alkalitelluris TaxID=304268 RepID=UPI000995FDD8|nr:TrkH family potassium uptake protein [Litchfieldia alkalitelluris]
MYLLKKKINTLSPAQLIVSFYLLAVIISVSLLSLPIALKPGVNWSFIDVIFTAVSAISVTGLGVVSTADTFSTAGIFILMFILQFGGIGIMTLGTFFWLLIGKKIGLKERRLIMTDQNQSNLSGLVSLMKQILLIIIIIELIGAAVLGTYFMKYYSTWQEAYLQGLFASVSATTNAGFDITGASLIPFANDYFVQFINIILLTLGAIGFPVLIEVKDFIFNKDKSMKYRFSLYTKLTTITFFGLMIFGTVAILLLEWNYFFSDKTWHESFFYAFFQSSTTRNGGLATMDVSLFSEPTLLLICFLMFIGASPSSVGGGVRTTTFALNLLFLYSFARGYKSIKIFKRELHPDDVLRSLAVTMMAGLLCFISVIILRFTEPFSTVEILFEVTSAFGTTGLSMGITPELSSIGKVIIILLMFIGRIGILSFIFLINRETDEVKYHYPKERIIIG